MTLEELNASKEKYVCEICYKYEATIYYPERNTFLCEMCDREPFWDLDTIY